MNEGAPSQLGVLQDTPTSMQHLSFDNEKSAEENRRAMQF